MSFYTTQADLWKDWNYAHPIILHGLIRSLKPSVVLEVGCYRAFSTCWMAKALQENNKGKLFTIDNWSLKEHVERYGDPRAHAVANMEKCGVREFIEILDGKSDEVVWPDAVDFAYIDGWHSYEACKREFLEAEKRGAQLIALDDTNNCVGPRMFAEEVAVGWMNFQRMHIPGDNGLTIFLRNTPKPLITFSQELPNHPGVDLRPLTLLQQQDHFNEAANVTGLDYSEILGETEHA